MIPIQKNTSELLSHENEIHKALRAWYITPGIQRELRHKENEAVQVVLGVLERRRVSAKL